MTRYIGLLRAVNIGPYNQISMPALTNLLRELGFDEPRTLLQSGNIVFGANRRQAADLERTLAAEVEQRLAIATDFFVRTASEWRQVVAGNPFPREARLNPGHLILMTLKDKPAAQAARDLDSAITGSEIARIDGKHAYIIYPDGIGRSRLTIALIEKKLGTRGTGRNWNTVLKLEALVRT